MKALECVGGPKGLRCREVDVSLEEELYLKAVVFLLWKYYEVPEWFFEGG